MRPHDSAPGRTYRFYIDQPVYPFGYGLSYTTFTYSVDSNFPAYTDGVPTIQMKSLSHYDLKQTLGSYSVTVTNTGTLAGANVVLGYISHQEPSAPLQELFGFDRVFLAPGQNATVVFDISLESVRLVDSRGMTWLRPGTVHVRFTGTDKAFPLQIQGSAILI